MQLRGHEVDSITADQVLELVNQYKQWSIGSNEAGGVYSKAHFDDHPDRSYNLKNKLTERFLQYEEQNWGINLGWTENASAETAKRVSRWFFARQEGTGGPVRYGETIALANGKGRSFLHYEGRPRGINLDWSNPPIFEWQVLGGKTGSPVQRGSHVAIFNVKVHEFFTYFDRNLGGDIGWSDSERWGDILTGKLKDLVQKYGDDAVKAAVIAAMA
jgi:hypothetical protein